MELDNFLYEIIYWVLIWNNSTIWTYWT